MSVCLYFLSVCCTSCVTNLDLTTRLSVCLYIMSVCFYFLSIKLFLPVYLCSLQLIMAAEAEAESIRMKGEAEAYAVEAKGRAEAEQMAKKAEAFQQYKEGAMVDMLLEKLPLIAEEIAKPLAATQKVTMISSGGGDVGAAKLTGEVLDIMTRLPDAVEKLTGVCISQVTRTG